MKVDGDWRIPGWISGRLPVGMSDKVRHRRNVWCAERVADDVVCAGWGQVVWHVVRGNICSHTDPDDEVRELRSDGWISNQTARHHDGDRSIGSEVTRGV